VVAAAPPPHTWDKRAATVAEKERSDKYVECALAADTAEELGRCSQ